MTDLNGVARDALNRWGIEAQPAFHSKFDSYIFQVEHQPERYILRLTENSHRTADQVEAELHWIKFLHSNEVGVAEPLISSNQRLVESFESESGTLHATIFREADGQSFEVSLHWRPEFLGNLGRLLGRMHAVTGSYTPPRNVSRPSHMAERDLLNDAEQHLPRSDTAAWREVEEVMEWINGLPVAGDSHGLIHTDVHPGNYFVDEKLRIMLFDFDDCQYHWFAYDLAIPLLYFYLYSDLPEPDASSTDWFFGTVLEAYQEMNILPVEWVRRIPGFVRFRRIDFYVLVHMVAEDESMRKSDWIAFDRVKEGLTNREPLL